MPGDAHWATRRCLNKSQLKGAKFVFFHALAIDFDGTLAENGFVD
jgi:hypothetical protein